MKYILILVFVVIFSGCSNQTQTKSSGALVSDSTVATPPTTTINFQETDSVEFIYYPNPTNQREYQNFFIRDKKIIDQLIANVSLPTTSKDACVHNAKLYLFNNGEVFKTIYYSDSCKYLAYAVNSNQNFVSLNNESYLILDSLIKTLSAK